MKKLLVLAGLMIMLLTGCATAGKGETTTEPSSKTPNSVVGKWYVYDGYEMVSIWEFQKNGKYYLVDEKNYGKESDSFQISRYPYTVDGNNMVIDGFNATVEYTDYGFNLTIQYPKGEAHYQMYEYRQQALEASEGYWTSELFYAEYKDKKGFVIVDGVLMKYFTKKTKIEIPDNVTEIGPGAIVMEAEDKDGYPKTIEKLTIPGTVKKIGMSAFNETSLRKIIIKDGVEEIGDYAFADSYFDEIHIPASVKSIGEFAFECSEGNSGKIYIKKGSYAEEYFKEYPEYERQLVVED